MLSTHFSNTLPQNLPLQATKTTDQNNQSNRNKAPRFGCCGQEVVVAGAAVGLLGGTAKKIAPQTTENFVRKHPKAAQFLKLTPGEKKPKSLKQKLAALIFPLSILGAGAGTSLLHTQYVIPQENAKGYDSLYYVSGAAKRQFPDKNPLALEENFQDLLHRTRTIVAQHITTDELRAQVEALPILDLDREPLQQLLTMIEHSDHLRSYDENFMNLINQEYQQIFTEAQIQEIHRAASEMQADITNLSSLKQNLPQIFMFLMLIGGTSLTGPLSVLLNPSSDKTPGLTPCQVKAQNAPSIEERKRRRQEKLNKEA